MPWEQTVPARWPRAPRHSCRRCSAAASGCGSYPTCARTAFPAPDSRFPSLNCDTSRSKGRRWRNGSSRPTAGQTTTFTGPPRTTRASWCVSSGLVTLVRNLIVPVGRQNGIDSVCIALGQDWRAIEAASHAYACRSGRYQALTKYWIEKNEAGEDVFMGELELPLAVGTKGGVLKTHPTYGYNLHIAGNPDAKQLSRILVCVGLAQNFAALRALTTEGIQRGHLSLHSRNIAIAAGAPPHAVAEVTAYMIETNRMTVDAAQQYLRAHEILGIVRQRSSPVDGPSTALPPSMLYYEDEVTGNENPLSGVETRVTFNIAFDTWTSSPNYLEYMANTERTSLASVLFGQRTYAWLSELMKLVTKLQLPGDYTRHNRVDIRRLKLISIVINVLARRLMAAVPAETFAFVDTHLFASSKPRLRERPKGDSMSRPRALSQPRVARAASIADISVRLAAMHDLVPPSVDSYVTEVRAQRRGSAKHPAQDYHVDWLFPPDLSASPAEAFPAEGLSEEKKQMIQVGFPLLLAMLQVFQLIVTERVGQPELVSQILAEQRRVLSAIVCAPLAHDCSSAADYEEFFAVHRKRFQMTLFLLLDATALDEATTDEATWDYCRKLGESVGDLVTRAHDAARLERDRGVASGGFALDGSLSGGRAVNSFVLWMAARGNDPQSIFTPDGKIAPDAQNTLAEFLADGPAVDMLSSDARKAYFKAKSAVAEHYSLL
ncbi:hypothetical protein DFJ74DRAFT_138541 [Hyaloraphidium curvatum]|nr:hypothetical protein DFJ74DRAFT_138541 [Hyaloraphidium curvatum]